MSNLERCVNILDGLNESQLAFVVPMLQNFKAALLEAEDEAFCNALYEEYKADQDKGQAISLEDAAAALGVAL